MTRRFHQAALLAAVLIFPAAGMANGHADFGKYKPSPEARTVADWAVQRNDHQGRAFAMLDKRQARLYIFDGAGKLVASTAVLLGFAKGDDSVPGIGEKKVADVKPEERTTPAGRFVLEPGRNLSGEDILWVSYDEAVSMHRVRANNPKERRLQRLASSTVADNRISYGCINIPAAFYDQHVKPLLSTGKNVAYVLPEVKPLQKVFGMQDPG